MNKIKNQKCSRLVIIAILIILVAGIFVVLSIKDVERPTEISEFSSDYSNARVYEITGSNLDIQAMNSYPQHIENPPEKVGRHATITLLVKNQTYHNLPVIPIDGQVYPKSVLPYTKKSKNIIWADDTIINFASEINDDTVVAYVRSAIKLISSTLVYDDRSNDSEFAEDFWFGRHNRVTNSEEALAQKMGSSCEYTNLLLAVLRSRGIPARFVSGIIHSESRPHMGPFGYHYWAEFYLQDYGWIPIDAVNNRFGISDYYIKLYVGKDYADIGISPYATKLEKVESQALFQ